MQLIQSNYNLPTDLMDSSCDLGGGGVLSTLLSSFLWLQFGDSQQLRMVRILRSTLMVRVGGGWTALDEFLVKNDPCRGKGYNLEREYFAVFSMQVLALCFEGFSFFDCLSLRSLVYIIYGHLV